jgi:hypothetical protein
VQAPADGEQEGDEPHNGGVTTFLFVSVIVPDARVL